MKATRRAYRLARTAVVLRQRGDVDRAMHYEARLDKLQDQVEDSGNARLIKAVTKSAELGQRAGHHLYHKSRPRKRRRVLSALRK